MSKQSETQPGELRPELDDIIILDPTEAEVTVKALMSHVRKLENALEKSIIDPTTNLLNKNGYERVILPDLERTLREGVTWEVLFGDLDKFKPLNDTYGHASGNLALECVGKAINDSIRPYDHATRWGGDEFCILLKDTAREKDTKTRKAPITDRVANRINEKLDRTLLPEHSDLSISFGSSTITRIDDIASAINRADLEALSYKSGLR